MSRRTSFQGTLQAMKSTKRHDRASALYRILTSRRQRSYSLGELCGELECSESTAKRLIRDLRNQYNHPIEFDREHGGYVYNREPQAVEAFEMPGLWFMETELRALLTMRHLLGSIDSGRLAEEVAPFGAKIEELLATMGAEPGDVARRIRIIGIADRPVDAQIFRCSADAVLQRRKMAFRYTPRSRPIYEVEDRTVSPQRLVHYRDNWYLDGWCHARNALRTFALDQMEEVRRIDEVAIDVDDAQLDEILKSSYGIFAGKPTATALLRFSPERAQWVSKEIWHRDQQGRFLLDGSWEVSVPYSVPHELVMDILKHGAHVEAVEPESLRREIVLALESAAAMYKRQG
jgi:predicted DNA-binding transcriptional regulator YafY